MKKRAIERLIRIMSRAEEFLHPLLLKLVTIMMVPKVESVKSELVAWMIGIIVRLFVSNVASI